MQTQNSLIGEKNCTILFITKEVSVFLPKWIVSEVSIKFGVDRKPLYFKLHITQPPYKTNSGLGFFLDFFILE